MAELPSRPPLPPASVAAPSPLPTPPSSTTTIPPLCFPSPTSVADVAVPARRDQSRKKVIHQTSLSNHSSSPALPAPAAPPVSNVNNVYDSNIPPNVPPSSPPSENLLCASHHTSTQSLSSLPDDSYYCPQLVNPVPSQPLENVTKAQFVAELHRFVNYHPPNSQVEPHILANRMRTLLDHLDALVESLSLRVTNDLFDALSHPKCLSMLLFLLADISARSTPVIQDVRKSYRYPYLVTNILANGSMGIRDVFIASEPLVAHLLSFLDGNVVLSAPSSTDQPDNLLPLACENPIIVGNVVQILVSYLETSPDALLNMLDKRPSFLPSLVNLLSIGSAPKLLVAIVPDRCVDDVASMDHCNVSFDAPLTKAVTVLANGTIFHNLANAFVLATQTIYSRISNPVEAHDAQEQSYVEQLSYNVIQVYSALVRKLLRAVRINTTMPACQYLNVFATSTTASTISEILRAGIELFRETKGKEVSTLDSALSLIIDLFRYVEQDRERRVASVTGQPPALDTSALEAELKPFLRALMFVLIDVVYTGQQHASIRLRILEVFVECTRVCSNDMLSFVSELRFASVALKVMLLNPKNSVMQHVVCRGVETALISNVSCAILVHHWLIRAKLIEKVITTWENECGDQKWGCPRDAQQAPFLSALVHIACCIQHYLAIQAENPSGDGWPQVGAAELKAFEWFCTKSLSPILAEEVLLCGPKPRRRLVRGTGNIGRSFGVLGSTSGGLLRRSGTGSALASGGAHLVRSPSAHRFGYVPPVSSLRSRFDEVFVEGGDEEFGAGSGCSSLVSVFDLGDALG